MEIIKESEESKICRICLDKVNTGIELFSDNKKCIEVLDKLFLCFQVVLEHQRSFPNIICLKCNEELDIANNFRLKCITFEERFLNFCQTIAEEKLSNNDGFDDNELTYGENTEERNVTNHQSAILDSDRTVFTCEICGKCLKSKMSLSKHKISMHQKRKHIGKVTGTGSERRYHCNKCSYSTPHSQTLVNHMRRHDGIRPYQCFCGKAFTQSSSLNAHKKTHTDAKLYTCSTCGKQFKHAFVLKNHQRVHENIGSFSCDICEKVLKSQSALNSHMLRHANIRNYSCETCGATFISSSELINHKKIHDKRTMECHLCGYVTYCRRNLVLHLKRHTGEKPYKCDMCSVALLTSSALQQHKRVHTHEKPFSCPTCAQRFSHSNSLNKHLKNIHGAHFKWSDIKPQRSTTLHIKHEEY